MLHLGEKIIGVKQVSDHHVVLLLFIYLYLSLSVLSSSQCQYQVLPLGGTVLFLYVMRTIETISVSKVSGDN